MIKNIAYFKNFLQGNTSQEMQISLIFIIPITKSKNTFSITFKKSFFRLTYTTLRLIIRDPNYFH